MASCQQKTEVRKDGTRHTFWQVRWRDPGGRQRGKRCSSRKAARRVLAEAQECEDLGVVWTPARGGGSPCLVAVVTAYLQHVRRVGALETAKTYAGRLARFLEWSHEQRRRPTVALLSRGSIEAYFSWLGITSARQYTDDVVRLWRWAWDSDEFGDAIERPRKPRLPRAPHPQPKRVGTWAEVDAAVLALPERFYRAGLWARSTGLRRWQVLRLEWPDLDFGRGELLIRPALGKSHSERRGRVVPLAPWLLEVASGWGRREGLIVTDEAGDLRGAFTKAARRAWQRVGGDPAVWKRRPVHALRATFETEVVAAGASRECAEWLVGHDLGTFGAYVAPRGLSPREAVATIPPLGESAHVVRTLPGAVSKSLDVTGG